MKRAPLDTHIQCIVYPQLTTDAQMETICIVNDLIIQQVLSRCTFLYITFRVN